MSLVHGRLQKGDTVALGKIQENSSMLFLKGMIEEASQNALQSELDSAKRNSRDINIDLAQTMGFEMAARRLGETLSRDGPHANLIDHFRNQIKPSHHVTTSDGKLIDTNQIGASRSHRVHANGLARENSANDPLVMDRTPPVSLYPGGKPPRHHCQNPEVLEMFDSSEEEIVLIKKKKRSEGDGETSGVAETTGGGETEVEDIIDRCFDRTISRKISGESPGAKGRFIKMSRHKDIVRDAAKSYIRGQKKKGKPLLSQECSDTIEMLLPDTPQK